MDDRALVEALLAGNPHAPRLLVERYQGVVFGLCLRMMGHRHDAEDVIQETFVRALAGSRASTASGRSAPGCSGSRPTGAGPPWRKRGRRPVLTEATGTAPITGPG